MSNPAIKSEDSVSPFKRMGMYLPMVIILGLAIPALVYLSIMETLGWPLPMVGVRTVVNKLAPATDKIILYVSDGNKNYYTKIGGNYEVLAVPWRSYFAEKKRSFEEISDISKIKKYQEAVLILPSALTLSDVERAEIDAFRSRGGSVLATWATGTRNGRGDWEGWQFLESLGVKMIGEIPADSDVRQLVFNGESPVSHTLPVGQRTWMSKTAEPLLRLKGEMVGGRFMNWARIVDDDRRGEGAVLFTETIAKPNVIPSRAAVFAFAETTWESHPLITHSLIDDTLKWLQREPAMIRAAWPRGRQAAQVIEMDTEEGFENAPSFASMMRAMRYRATFYVLTSVGKQHPEILNQLAKDFEVAYHGDVHDSFKGQSVPLQERRLTTMRQDMGSVLGDTKNIRGFRAPTEGYDATTEALLHKMGVQHHAADPERAEGRLPFFAKLEGVDPDKSLVVLPRTQRDDINLARQNLSVEQTSKALIDDFDLAFETGALGWLSVHSQNFGPDAVLVKAMPNYLAHVGRYRDRLWLASADQVAVWWRDRDRFKLSSSYSGRRLAFDITIKGSTPLAGASAIVMLPRRGVLPTVRPAKIGSVEPVVSKIDDYRALILFDTLDPGNHAYLATFSGQ